MGQEHPANLLDVLDELLQLPIDQRRQRLADLSLPAADRTRLEEWLDRAPQSKAFLNASPAIVRQASELLAGDDTQPKPADCPNSLAAVSELLSAAPLPPQVPGYEIKGLLGQGGMATVWRAVQGSTAREVALKVMEPLLLASPRARARFDRELRLTARLEHPNIARVYDGGSAGTVCYYAMELIEGEPLDTYVQRLHLAARKILELIVLVCQGVRHAHQNGVIHRDLKPSNILVDANGQPHVLDFGLARALEESGTDITVTTDGTLAGTIAFMSPEQATGQHFIDTRSDVYSLGVILYLLLTGQPPYDVTGPRELVLKRITDEIPRRPSRVYKAVDSELDWVILKALEKDPARRYDTAHSLAEDIKRYLHHEPVDASPPSARYRLRKFIRKNRVPLVVTLAFAIVLIAATIVSTRLAIRATYARDAEATQRKQSEAAEALLESVFRGLDSRDIEKDTDFRKRIEAGMDLAAKELNTTFAGAPAVRVRLLNVMGATQLALGDAAKAIALFQRALDECESLRPPNDLQSLTTRNNLGRAYRRAGRPNDAIRVFEYVRDQRVRMLGQNNPDTLLTLRDLASAYALAGWDVEAVTLLEQLRNKQTPQSISRNADDLAMLNLLANEYRAAGRTGEARDLLEKIRNWRTELLGADHPDTLDTLWSLAGTYEATGREKESIELYERVFERRVETLGPDHWDTLISENNLAMTYRHLGREADAKRMLSQVQDLGMKKLNANDSTAWPPINALAVAHLMGGRYADAIALFERVRDLQRKQLGPENSGTLVTENNLALAYRGAGRNADAMKLIEEVLLQQSKMLGRTHPDTMNTIENLAYGYRVAGRYDDSIRLYEELKDARTRIFRSNDPSTLQIKYKLADLYYAIGRDSKAEPLLREGIEQYFTHATHTPAEDRTMSVTITKLIACCQSLGKKEATAHWEQVFQAALESDLPVDNKEVEDAGTLPSKAFSALGSQASLYFVLGRFSEAEPDFKKMVQVQPSVHRGWYALACLQCYLNDRDGYRTTCRELLARFGNTTQREIADRTAKACVLAPPSAEDMPAILKLADLAIGSEPSPNTRYFELAKGMAEYRNGQFGPAIDSLTRSHEELARVLSTQTRSARDALNNDECLATAEFYISMAQYRAGSQSEAKETLRRARQQLASHVPDVATHHPKIATEDWLIVHIAAREADALMGKEDAPAGAGNH